MSYLGKMEHPPSQSHDSPFCWSLLSREASWLCTSIFFILTWYLFSFSKKERKKSATYMKCLKHRSNSLLVLRRQCVHKIFFRLLCHFICWCCNNSWPHFHLNMTKRGLLCYLLVLQENNNCPCFHLNMTKRGIFVPYVCIATEQQLPPLLP